MKNRERSANRRAFYEAQIANMPATWIEINAAAFDHNVRQYKRAIGSSSLAAVVKANAYGHGIEIISKLAQKNPLIDQLCVATAREALLLKKIGITKPILVLSFLDIDAEQFMDHQTEFTIGDDATLNKLNEIGIAHDYRFPVHLKIDTGLSRFGFDPKKALVYSKKINVLEGLEFKGIYSHCSESSNQNQAFTLHQRALFKGVVDECISAGINLSRIHFANSAATTSLDLNFCNLFRVGLGLFGLWPSEANKQITQKRFPGFDLSPIMSWKAYIAAIRTVKKGSYIGYDRTYQAPHDMRIAALPIGYFDGYDFRLYNKASMLLHNQYASIVGRIAMNVTCIDITHIMNVRVGDEVIIMGPQLRIHPYQLGVLAGNPNVREMTTKINPILPRIVAS